MDKISLMLTFNNHLQYFQTNNGELSRIKKDENNNSRQQTFLQNALSRKNWDFLIRRAIREIWFWKQISILQDMWCCLFDSMISQLGLCSLCEEIKKVVWKYLISDSSCSIENICLLIKMILFHFLLNIRYFGMKFFQFGCIYTWKKGRNFVELSYCMLCQ